MPLKTRAKSFKRTKRQDKVKKVLHEFKRGTLRSASGHKVTDRRQALAIAISESKRRK